MDELQTSRITSAKSYCSPRYSICIKVQYTCLQNTNTDYVVTILLRIK